MRRKQSGQVEWLEFDLLSDILKVHHAVFLRHGGHSQEPYGSLNTSFNVGDCAVHVNANLKSIQALLKNRCPNWVNLVRGIGIHSKSIAIVNEQSPQIIPNCDGLMTATPGLSLMMGHADCQVALFYDPINHAAANIHAGWRGMVANIYQETIRVMQKTFRSDPANLLVCITPSLGPDEAEFIHYAYELPEEFWPFQIHPTYFDFWAIAEYQLQRAGILPHHIEIARLSTYSNPHDFFSYRRDKVTGRHASCLTLSA